MTTSSDFPPHPGSNDLRLSKHRSKTTFRSLANFVRLNQKYLNITSFYGLLFCSEMKTRRLLKLHRTSRNRQQAQHFSQVYSLYSQQYYFFPLSVTVRIC